MEDKMNIRVDENRFLSVTCEPEERVVFDRQEKKYHLLRESAARLWDEIGEGGAFDLATVTTEAEDPIAQLVDAGLVSVGLEPSAPREVTRRVWLKRTGKASAAAIVLPLVASIATPKLVLGQSASPVDLNEENTGLDEVEETVELTARERRRLRREQKKLNGDGSSDSPIEDPTQEPTELTARERRRLRRETKKQDGGGSTTPTLDQPQQEEEEKTSSVMDFFNRRYGN
ncbi:MAG TPA: hypothetical protein VFH82_12045 [Gemmatimonadota bacterium]|jgi:hypothetical protein|nr:hypothetical protein [Gemmatimonadota bacterium]